MTRYKFLLYLLPLFLCGCSSSDDPAAVVPAVNLDLSVAIAEAQTLGYAVSRVEAELVSKTSTKTYDLTVSGQEASAEISGLSKGDYEITLRILVEAATLVSGTEDHSLNVGTTVVAFGSIDWDSLFPESPRNMLFIGNSLTNFNGGLGNHMADFVASANPVLGTRSTQVAPGGYTLEQHWTEEPSASVSALKTGEYDLVFLQGSPSNMVNNPSSFRSYAESFIWESARQGAAVSLFVPPSYENEPDFIDDLVEQAEWIAARHDVILSPISQAWYKAIAMRPYIKLFDEDRVHPSPHGTYLDLCVIYAAVFRQSPEGTEWVSSELITNSDRDFLQSVAWDVTVDYLGFDLGE